MLEKNKIAIVYDWFDKWGGVERVLLTFHEMFPKADFFTSYFDKEKAIWAKNFNIKTSFIQYLPKIINKNRVASLPFYPYAFESFDLKNYNLVISVTSSFAKAVITQPQTKHICYLLTPTRFLWSHQKDYFKNDLIHDLTDGYLSMLKDWDKIAAERPDKILSISDAVRERCKKYYKRDSQVIYPPFDIDYWTKISKEIPRFAQNNRRDDKKFYLIVSRLEPYKKVDLVIKVFNKINKQLVIVGEGTQENYLKKLSQKNIRFMSKLKDINLASLYSSAEALIMPQEEDFGYVSLEAQFFGCPVIAFEKGGAKETVIDKKTGIFFSEQKEGSLSGAVERFEKIRYNLKDNTLKEGFLNIEKFSKESFIRRFKSIL